MAIKLKFAVMITLILAATPFYSRAEKRQAESVVKSEGYFGVDADPGSSFCQYAMLSNQTGKSAAAFLLSYANSSERMIQFLYDSRVIFSSLYQDAFLHVLTENGVIDFPEVRSSASPEEFLKNKWTNLPIKKVRNAVKSLKNLYSADDKTLAPMVWSILDSEILLVNKENDETIAEARAQYLRELKTALADSPQRAVFESVMAQIARESLLSTALNFVNIYRGLSQQRIPVGVKIAPLTILFTYATYITAGFLDDPSIPIVLGLLYSVPVYGVHWLGEQLMPFGRTIKPKTVTYKISADYAKQIEVQTQSIFNTVSESAPDLIDLPTACSQDICKLSPVQIMTLGQVDRLVLERMKTQLAAILDSKSLNAAIDGAKVAASRVRINQDDFIAQVALHQSLKELHKQLTEVENLESTAVQNLITRVNAVRQSLERLQKEPYELLRRTDTTSDQVWRLALIGQQVKGDLDNLRNLRVATEALSARLEKLKSTAKTIQQLMNRLPDSPDGWRDAASTVAEALDGMSI